MGSLGFWLKLVFSLVALGYVIAISNPQQLLPALGKADPAFLLVGVALWGVIQLLNVFKWWLITNAQGLVVSYRQLLNVYFIGMFFNMFLPSGFGGDALRAYEMSRLTRQAGSSTVSVILDRCTSLYALLLMASVALVFAPQSLRVVPLELLVGLDLLGALGILTLLNGRWVSHIKQLRVLATRERIQGFLTEIEASTTSLRSSMRIVLISLGISLAFQFLSVVEHHLFIKALGIKITFASTALFFPILTIASSLPISVNGLGIREGGYVYFLGLLGIERGVAVLVGLLSFSMLLLSGAWGAVVYLRTRRANFQPKIQA